MCVFLLSVLSHKSFGACAETVFRIPLACKKQSTDGSSVGLVGCHWQWQRARPVSLWLSETSPVGCHPPCWLVNALRLSETPAVPSEHLWVFIIPSLLWRWGNSAECTPYTRYTCVRKRKWLLAGSRHCMVYYGCVSRLYRRLIKLSVPSISDKLGKMVYGWDDRPMPPVRRFQRLFYRL